MYTVLIIDDDERLCDTVALMLESEGFRAFKAHDGQTGLEKALSLRPAVVLADLRMPGLRGAEVCRQLRASRLPTSIIVLSAIKDEVDKVLLFEMGRVSRA